MYYSLVIVVGEEFLINRGFLAYNRRNHLAGEEMTQSKINRLVQFVTRLCITYAIAYVALAHLMRFTSPWAEYVDPNLMWVQTFGPVWDFSPFMVLTIPFALKGLLPLVRKDEVILRGSGEEDI